MGMDISGKNPVNETGEYFRFSIWSWRPMIEFVKEIAPELFDKIEYPYSNDGSGLNDRDSKLLANKIREAMKCEVGVIYFAEKLQEKPSSWQNGKVIETSKFADPERFLEFADFLENCGGFEIW